MDEKVDIRNKSNNRTRKIIWFSLQFNMTVANKIGKELYRLLKKNFAPSSNLYKISHRNTVKFKQQSNLDSKK